MYATLYTIALGVRRERKLKKKTDWGGDFTPVEVKNVSIFEQVKYSADTLLIYPHLDLMT